MGDPKVALAPKVSVPTCTNYSRSVTDLSLDFGTKNFSSTIYERSCYCKGSPALVNRPTQYSMAGVTRFSNWSDTGEPCVQPLAKPEEVKREDGDKGAATVQMDEIRALSKEEMRRDRVSTYSYSIRERLQARARTNMGESPGFIKFR